MHVTQSGDQEGFAGLRARVLAGRLDIFGASGRDVLAALIAGERSPKVLAQLARGRVRAKLSVLEEAFTGFFTDHHGFLLAKMLARVDALDADIAELDRKLAELIVPVQAAVDRLDEVTGVGQTAAQVIRAFMLLPGSRSGDRAVVWQPAG